MKTLKVTAFSIILSGFFLLLFQSTAEATLKYRKETGKLCVFCHTRIPEPAQDDPELTEDGQMFRENGYNLTEDQKE